MDWLTLARAVHVLSVVHWIGGLAFVTLVVLPATRRLAAPADRLALFETVEGRFAFQARISVTLAGLSGFAMTHLLGAWDRFADPGFWWMHLMAALWAIFTFVLFIAEPAFLHRWFHEAATREPERIFAFVHRAHFVLLALTAIAVGGAVLGSHGALY